MGNLVIAMIGIALVVVLTSATFYYMSSAADERLEAEAVQLRNEAQQIAAAVKLYEGDGNSFGSDFRLETLVDLGYLSQLPEIWEPGEDRIMHVLQNPESAEKICFLANKQAGFTFDGAEEDVIPYSEDELYAIPLCSKAGLNPMVPCCSGD